MYDRKVHTVCFLEVCNPRGVLKRYRYNAEIGVQAPHNTYLKMYNGHVISLGVGV